jgi:serine/threonine protein kinase HipA of HipAB toxin-antitoxin module
MLAGFSRNLSSIKKDVGGRATLPPTSRLRAACIYAHLAAYAETARQAVSDLLGRLLPAGGLDKNGRPRPEKDVRYARAIPG